ncbi:MAG: hypothetical protein RBS76_04495 [Acholeplasmatales bacterium]|jgi:ABC-type multidrug transport system permease subunit|nr:hypothetical protein [Acholeplasmataceae bacterium]MDY0115738.1 hypothetical protein [Acholeplasmatales bacterium]MCK9234327.1 hypothetical protein [Acholeplasmataceae bacterium]MCK9289245.1 hypothetical protein [Acholeplasmataceae bacterium]MCK9427649.1 hypothetical protein [Acholeplasmataceae bacterium]
MTKYYLSLFLAPLIFIIISSYYVISYKKRKLLVFNFFFQKKYQHLSLLKLIKNYLTGFIVITILNVVLAIITAFFIRELSDYPLLIITIIIQWCSYLLFKLLFNFLIKKNNNSYK